MAKRILRPKESQARLGIGHTKFYELIRDGKLRPPLKLGPQTSAHTEDEIDALIDSLVAERNRQAKRR
jgi:predicted DNA-binding transcriptional regulator AlpA